MKRHKPLFIVILFPNCNFNLTKLLDAAGFEHGRLAENLFLWN